MYALCVSGAVNTQGFVWKFFYALYINFHSFIQYILKPPKCSLNEYSLRQSNVITYGVCVTEQSAELRHEFEPAKILH